MANRRYEQFQFSLEKMVVTLYGSVTIGATGAVGTVKGGGISGIVRNSAGNYTITLTDKFNRLLMASVLPVNNAAGGSGVFTFEIKQDPNTMQATFVSAGTLVLQCRDAAGAAVDPANNTTLYLEIKGRNSSVAIWD